MKQAKFTQAFTHDLTYDKFSRLRKAKKIISVLEDDLGKLSNLNCLDLGCSIGIISTYLAEEFKSVVGADVDDQAIGLAKTSNTKKNLKFILINRKLPFNDSSFDVVICNQVYEHTDSPKEMFSEIHRVLKTGGVCFFGARNKISLFDGHYPLPLISVLPKNLANLYIRLCTDKKNYDISLFNLWQLEDLVRKFKKHDYTLKIIRQPSSFSAEDYIPNILGLNIVFYLFFRLLYFLIPNYIWVLEK